MIWKLLRKHVPEVTSGIIKVLGIAREPGKRSVLVVTANDPKVDPVGTCVARFDLTKRIGAELGGREILDVVRWDESVEGFIANLLSPLRLTGVSFDQATREARAWAIRLYESDRPDFALRCKLLMDLTGWKLRVEVKDEG